MRIIKISTKNLLFRVSKSEVGMSFSEKKIIGNLQKVKSHQQLSLSVS